MMRTVKVLAVLVAFSALSACQATVRSPEVEVEGPGGVEVKIKDGESHKDNGKFCPPGQAKKGNC